MPSRRILYVPGGFHYVDFGCGFLDCNFKVCIILLILFYCQVTSMKKKSFKHYCFSFSNVYQNNNNIKGGFPSTSGPTPGSSELLDLDCHKGYGDNGSHA